MYSICENYVLSAVHVYKDYGCGEWKDEGDTTMRSWSRCTRIATNVKGEITVYTKVL